jgi:hypothetical protein
MKQMPARHGVDMTRSLVGEKTHRDGIGGAGMIRREQDAVSRRD